MTQPMFTHNESLIKAKFPVDQYNLPWPIPASIDDSRFWTNLGYDERMKTIGNLVKDWHHEDWMQVLAD